MKINKKSLFIFSALLFSFFSYGQNFSKKYFTKTYWFSDNKDSLFYKADTLKFIKHTNFGPEWTNKSYAEDEMGYLNHGDFVEIIFGKGKKLNFNWRKNNYLFTIPIKRWNWKYDKKSNIVSIYDDKNVLIISFKPIYEQQIKIESYYVSETKLTTTELTVIRIK